MDSNLKVLPVSSAFLVGLFDKNSIMKYQFPAFFFRAEGQSPCFKPNDNRKLSAEDIAGARKAYRGAVDWRPARSARFQANWRFQRTLKLVLGLNFTLDFSRSVIFIGR